jgi:hypothetical protein
MSSRLVTAQPGDWPQQNSWKQLKAPQFIPSHFLDKDKGEDEEELRPPHSNLTSLISLDQNSRLELQTLKDSLPHTQSRYEDGKSNERPRYQLKKPIIDWNLPSNLTRLGNYLIYHRAKIVFRLITSVSILNLTHENICCVTTALLILLLAQKR